jgi:hypothetical protein
MKKEGNEKEEGRTEEEKEGEGEEEEEGMDCRRISEKIKVFTTGAAS